MALTILQSLKKDYSIKHMLHRNMAGWEKARSTKTLHASELMKEQEFCPREYALLDLTGAKRQDQFLGTAQVATFAHGKDMEKRLRNEWLRDSVVGRWRCGVCQALDPRYGKAPKYKCQKCGYDHQWFYDEIRFASPLSGISGGIDAIVDVGDKKHRLLEVKSIDKDQFKELKAPLAEHSFRTKLYLRLVHESGLEFSDNISTKSAHVLYVSKSFGFKDESIKAAGIKDSPFSPFKEFVVQREDSVTQTAVNRATALNTFRQDNAKIPCGVCANVLNKRAQQCPVKGACWSGKFGATITWLEGGQPRHPGKTLVE